MTLRIPALACAIGMGACAAPAPDDGVIEPSFAGKADIFTDLAASQPIVFGGSASGVFDRDFQFAAYTFDALEDAEVTIEVTRDGSSSSLDTTMWLYRLEDDAHPSRIAFDDDDGWGALSRVESFRLYADGRYAVVLGTKHGNGRGDYTLHLGCDNGACEEPEPVCTDEPRRGCVFGVSTDATAALGYVQYLDSVRYEHPDEVAPEHEEWIVAGARGPGWAHVSTVEEAFDTVDWGGFAIRQLVDTFTGERYVHVDYGRGDNQYGAFLRADTTEAVARVGDGEIHSCTALVPARSTDPCADGPTATDEVVRRVLQEHGLSPAIDSRFPEWEVAQQLWLYEPDFVEALDAAVRSFVEDGDDVESPLGLATELDGDPACPQATASERVRCFLSNPETRLGIVPQEWDRDRFPGVYPPEGGESVDDNWVFYLSAPGLGDTSFWAVVDRADPSDTYNYGFD